MLFQDSYFTISKESESLYKIKGSKFIGLSFPIKSELEVKEKILIAKKNYPQANHYCYAFRLTADTSIYRCSDDREPSGSAGKPILAAILSSEITDTLIIVVRYFGGTLLGVPGLIAAYREAAQLAISSSGKKEIWITSSFEITFPIDKSSTINSFLNNELAQIKTQNYDQICKIVFEIVKSQENIFINKFKQHPTLPVFATLKQL